MRTLGVEEEFLLVDATGSVSPLAERVFLEAGKKRIPTPDGEPVAVAELKREQAELVSAPYQDLAALRSDLAARRCRVQEAAAGIGASAAAMATSPLRAGSSTTDHDRYQRIGMLLGNLGVELPDNSADLGNPM
jgi:carboxylate-amine ligase